MKFSGSILLYHVVHYNLNSIDNKAVKYFVGE